MSWLRLIIAASGAGVASYGVWILRGHLDHGGQSMPVFAGLSSRQDGVDSPVSRRDMLSIIAQ